MKYRYLALITALILFSSAQAAVVNLMPDDCQPAYPCWFSNDNDALNAGEVESITGASDLTLFYKYNVGGIEEGYYADSYGSASGFLPVDDESAGTISLLSGSDPIYCGTCFLVVKDGENPQYIFDISLAGLIEEINLSGFWEGTNGAISHVALYGDISAVPLPAAFWLFGSALIGFIAFSRRTNLA